MSDSCDSEICEAKDQLKDNFPRPSLPSGYAELLCSRVCPEQQKQGITLSFDLITYLFNWDGLGQVPGHVAWSDLPVPMVLDTSLVCWVRRVGNKEAGPVAGLQDKGDIPWRR